MKGKRPGRHKQAPKLGQGLVGATYGKERSGAFGTGNDQGHCKPVLSGEKMKVLPNRSTTLWEMAVMEVGDLNFMKCGTARFRVRPGMTMIMERAVMIPALGAGIRTRSSGDVTPALSRGREKQVFLNFPGCH